jgi:hypothetical protein
MKNLKKQIKSMRQGRRDSKSLSNHEAAFEKLGGITERNSTKQKLLKDQARVNDPESGVVKLPNKATDDYFNGQLVDELVNVKKPEANKVQPSGVSVIRTVIAVRQIEDPSEKLEIRHFQ